MTIMPSTKSNTSDFIKKAEKVHGDLYNYSSVEYMGCHKKVKIICQVHGVFEQIPSDHLQGKGCSKCGRIKNGNDLRSNTQEFVEKAQAVYGDLYNYSLVKYMGGHKKVKIICQVHEVFEQTPSEHLQGKGCSKCGHIKAGKARRLNTQEFVKKAQAVHGKYSYELVEYVNSLAKVKVICLIHGVFLVRPSNHLTGNGCPGCGQIERTQSKRSNTQEFARKAQAVHGKYSYESTRYVTNHRKVEITCSKHGLFSQTPASHLLGYGCPRCGIEKNSGVNHPDWNPLKTDEERLRNRDTYRSKIEVWRKSVFERDSYCCVKCHDSKGGNLNAHHVLPWSKHPNERFDVDNGVTLCEPCHDRYHSTYKLGKCNRDTLTAFLASNVVFQAA